MKNATKHKNVSVYLSEDARARLKSAVELVRARTGYPGVSMTYVAALAIERGLPRIIEENQNSVGVI